MSFSIPISGTSPRLPRHKCSLIFRFGKHNFYIFTRKDPFPGSKNGNKATSTSDAEMTVYGQTIRKEAGNSSTTIGTNIQNPHWFSWMQPSGSTYGWCPNTTPYYNSWSARNTTLQGNATSTDNIVVKTIYDPCPVGYTVAPVNAFSGMTNANGWSSTDVGSLQQGCWFPATGYRNVNSGGLLGVGASGGPWYAVPKTANNARLLWVSNGNADPASNADRSYGFTVRPVEEIEKKN